jgi:hypothetical protein
MSVSTAPEKSTPEKSAPLKTGKVAGRRPVRYENYNEFLAEAERLATMPTRTLGNWTQAQIYRHLAMGLVASIEGSGPPLPAPVRWVMTLWMKHRFIHQALPAGFGSPKKFIASDQTTLAEALAELRRAVERVKTETRRSFHPAFGAIDCREWDQFNLRHAEMHMSFIVPA